MLRAKDFTKPFWNLASPRGRHCYHLHLIGEEAASQGGRVTAEPGLTPRSGPLRCVLHSGHHWPLHCGPCPPGAFSGRKERRRRKVPVMVKRRDNRSSFTKKFRNHFNSHKMFYCPNSNLLQSYLLPRHTRKVECSILSIAWNKRRLCS